MNGVLWPACDPVFEGVRVQPWLAAYASPPCVPQIQPICLTPRSTSPTTSLQNPVLDTSPVCAQALINSTLKVPSFLLFSSRCLSGTCCMLSIEGVSGAHALVLVIF